MVLHTFVFQGEDPELMPYSSQLATTSTPRHSAGCVSLLLLCLSALQHTPSVTASLRWILCAAVPCAPYHLLCAPLVLVLSMLTYMNIFVSREPC